MQSLLEGPSALQIAALGAIATLLCYCLSLRYATPLRHLPGPWVASLTDLWRFWTVWNHAMPERSLELHKKHGYLVRLGPRYVSASSSDAVHIVYRAGTGFAKSDIYGMLQPQLDGSDLHNLFSTQDKAFHATLKRNLAGLYSQRGVKVSEIHIDRTIAMFIARLQGLAKTGSTRVDMSSWLQWWAFDTIGQINLSYDLGFIKQAKDIDHLCKASHEGMRYFGLMGQVLPLEKLYTKIMSLWSKGGHNPLFQFVLDRVSERKSLPEQEVDKLDSFLALSRERPEQFSERDVISATYITLVTAHDVLAITLRALMYYLAKTPRVFNKFKEEIEQAEKDGKLSSPAQYEETLELTYLNAVIMETLRIHPSTGLIFERLVPESGVILHDRFIPARTTIGVNAWVFNRDQSIFGKDSEDFRPERWIESSPEQLKEMRKWLLTFGVGARSCIGKNLAMMETTKLMIELYRHFNFRFDNPDWQWQFDGSWLTAQGKMEMIVEPL